MSTKIFAVYDWDQGPFIISAHSTPEQAIKGLSDHGYGKIMEWSLDDTFREAVDRWEAIGRPLQVVKTRTPTVEEQIVNPIQRDLVHILKPSPLSSKPTVTVCDLDTRLVDGLKLAESVAGITCTHCKKGLGIS